MTNLTKAQRKALFVVWMRARQASYPTKLGYREFRREVKAGWGCVMIYSRGLWLGIEPDGYTHS